MPKFRIDRTEPAQDGTGDIIYDVWALTDDDPPLVVPGKHAGIRCPYAEVQVVNNTTPNSAKLKELKEMLIRNKTGWSENELAEHIANNANAKIVDDEFDIIIDGVGGYPFDFDL